MYPGSFLATIDHIKIIISACFPFYYLAETKTTSIISATITVNKWNTTEINLKLHPELHGQPMTYFLISRERYTKNNNEKRIPWDNSINNMLNFTLRKLNPNTWYTFDVELRDKDSNISGPRMKTPLFWKTTCE